MNKSNKVLSGIFAFLPLVLLVVYLLSMVTFFVRFFQDVQLHEGVEQFPVSGVASLAGIIISAILLGLLSLGVMVYFIIHALNNTDINRDERIVWILVFIFVGTVTFPVYWYMRIWKQKDPPLPAEQ